MRRRLFQFTVAVALAMCVATIALWVWSQWEFTRMTCTYVSGPAKQRNVMFLIWRDAAEVIVKTAVYRPTDEAARAKLIRDLPREQFLDVYQQSGWRMADGGARDAADHWGFWYRSPKASRQATLAVSYTRQIGGQDYSFTEENERAFFLPWWFLALVFGILPAIVTTRRIRRSLRAWAGRCLGCGYDIRYATNRCPECGLAIPSQRAAPQ